MVLDNSYTGLPDMFYTKVHPVAVKAPKMALFNRDLAKSLGLNAEMMQSEIGIQLLAGNRVPEGSTPIAQAYAGHQFGHFTILGDGRAVLLGEQSTPLGATVDIQLKGSGRTPYSRGGDGRATVGPMLREYIISEAMHALGIPTTRSLAVVTTGELVLRETMLPGAVLTRVAASHLRVGTFQYAASRGTEEELRALADYTIKRHFSELLEDYNPYIALLREVIRRQALLISKWQLVGFIHGVMNTDNMTISGETIDYGPCAFMDVYNPKTVFSSIDTRGRYAYGNQPIIGQWNLVRFAETLLPLLGKEEKRAVEIAEDEISKYTDIYQDYWTDGMRAKLGLFNAETEDISLFTDLLKIMESYGADYTNTFLALTFDEVKAGPMFCADEFKEWHDRWMLRLNRQVETQDDVNELMRNSNPAVIPRNRRVEDALDSAVSEGDYTLVEKLVGVLSEPFSYNAEQAAYAAPPDPSDGPYQTFCGT